MEQPAGEIRAELHPHHCGGHAFAEQLSAGGLAGHGVSLQGDVYAEQCFCDGALPVRTGCSE